MPHFKINSENIVGFAAEKSDVGSTEAKICVKAPFITSDDHEFVLLLTQTTKVFLNKTKFPTDYICKFLIVLHKNNIADIYINDFIEQFRAKVKRNVKKGEGIFLHDISNITDLKFPDIQIKNDDAVIYCTKIGWKFGFYFDFTRKLKLSTLSKELGEIHKKLRFEKIEASINSTILSTENFDFILLTEGKTDWKHIKKAHLKLKNKLKIKYHENENNYGDQDLLKMCEHYSRVEQPTKMIFIFDKDNPKIINQLKERTENNKKFQNWGNNVYSMLLPTPSHRNLYKNISIEFFYTDNEIKTKDQDNRRLFFNNELKTEILPDKTCLRRKIKPDMKIENDKKIEDTDVKRTIDRDGNQIAISKTLFAENVYNDVVGFKKFNFNEFEKIFKVINSIKNNPK